LGSHKPWVAGEAGLTDIDDTGRVRPKPASRGEQRRRAFLDAAADVFLEQGYEAASVNEVVRRAGGSLATLYAQFGNKDGLFQAVIEDTTVRFSEPIMVAADANLPLEQGLQQIGEQFLAAILRPRALAFFRVMIGEGRKIPEMLERFITTGPERVRSRVAEYLLSRGCKEGIHLTEEEADFAGSFFCEMIRSRHQYRALAYDEYPMDEAEARRHVAMAVRFFLDGVRAR
jgi:AcrR family transcriptional regulator